MNGYCGLGIWVVDGVVGPVTQRASGPVGAWYSTLCAGNNNKYPINVS